MRPPRTDEVEERPARWSEPAGFESNPREFRPAGFQARTPRTPRAPREDRPDRPFRGDRPSGGDRSSREPGRDTERGPARAERPLRAERIPRADLVSNRRAPEIIYGRNSVLEAARAGRVRRAYIADGLEPDPRVTEISELVAIVTITRERMEVIAPGNNQGVAADLLPREYATLRGLLAAQPKLLLALDSILDPQNLGAILRTAEAAGVDGVIIPERRSAPVSAAVVKVSSGASELLRICRVGGLASAVAEVKRSGIWTVALDPRGDLAPWDFDFTQPVCIVAGGEEGVHRLVLQRCDARLRIPMAGRVDSLNASAAAAAVLYEVIRQRALDAIRRRSLEVQSQSAAATTDQEQPGRS